MDSTSSTTMMGLRLQAPGALDALAAASVPRPQVAAGDLLVRVHAAGVNPSDVLNARGLPLTTFPRVPGRDFAGVVETGPDELVGTRVWGAGSGDLGFTRDGSHAEYLAVPAQAAVAMPAGWTFAQAAASGLAYATAAIGLDHGGLRSGMHVLATGAAGGVGHAAAAIALHRGAHVVAAVKDAAEADRARAALPAATVLITQAGDYDVAVRDATGGHGVDLVFDTVGNPMFAPNLAALADDGTLVLIAARPGVDVALDLSQFYRRRLRLIGVSSTRADAAWCASYLRDLAPGFASGALPPVGVARAVALQRVADAYALTAAGGAAGRVVLTMEVLP
jgi:NADPH:quinone reductase-like Zn-dependent oxidoreductase